jgi:uncharacterized repeat protein (TIGR03806 family)
MRRLRLPAASLCALTLAACSAPEVPIDALITGDKAPERLSDFGFFHADGAPVDDLIAYDLATPLFSDHAIKERYAYIPEGMTATYSAADVFDFPVGSALIKTFVFAPDMRRPDEGARRIETRVLLHRKDGWVAYPYVWNEDQTDAVYAPIGASVRIETVRPDGQPVVIDYRAPNQNQCKTCHQDGKRIAPIGPAARHLNHDGPYGRNQIADWTARGVLAGAPAPEAAPALPSAFDPVAPLETRARAWLDINCAHCHNRSGGASNSGLFLRWDEQDPRGWGVGKRPVAAGRGAGDDMFVIAPGAPGESILVHRMASVEPGVAMPELGRSQPDPESVRLISEWIAAMPRDRAYP